MKIGDLVTDRDPVAWDPLEGPEIGIIVCVNRRVEIPPLIEVMWPDGCFTRTYQDELSIFENLKQGD
jgi:hypothetical protein